MAFTLGLILDAILLSLATRITPHVSEAAVGALNNRFESDVEIGSLQVSVFPRPEIIGSDLVPAPGTIQPGFKAWSESLVSPKR